MFTLLVNIRICDGREGVRRCVGREKEREEGRGHRRAHGRTWGEGHNVQRVNGKQVAEVKLHNARVGY